MFGAVYFGETPYAAAPVYGPWRPQCGGTYGGAAFGDAYYGQERYCGDYPTPVPPIPPVPPTPTSGRGGVGGESRKERLEHELEIQSLRRRRFHEISAARRQRAADREDEDLELIMALWLNLH